MMQAADAMTAIPVIAADVLAPEPPEMTLAHDDHVVEQILAHGVNPSLRHCVGPSLRMHPMRLLSVDVSE
jgi:hypothetical protein